MKIPFILICVDNVKRKYTTGLSFTTNITSKLYDFLKR